MPDDENYLNGIRLHSKNIIRNYESLCKYVWMVESLELFKVLRKSYGRWNTFIDETCTWPNNFI